MKRNIGKVLERGGKLDDLEDKYDILHVLPLSTVYHRPSARFTPLPSFVLCTGQRCWSRAHSRFSEAQDASLVSCGGKEQEYVQWQQGRGGKNCACVYVYMYVYVCVCVLVSRSRRLRCLLSPCVPDCSGPHHHWSDCRCHSRNHHSYVCKRARACVCTCTCTCACVSVSKVFSTASHLHGVIPHHSRVLCNSGVCAQIKAQVNPCMHPPGLISRADQQFASFFASAPLYIPRVTLSQHQFHSQTDTELQSTCNAAVSALVFIPIHVIRTATTCSLLPSKQQQSNKRRRRRRRRRRRSSSSSSANHDSSMSMRMVCQCSFCDQATAASSSPARTAAKSCGSDARMASNIPSVVRYTSRWKSLNCSSNTQGED